MKLSQLTKPELDKILQNANFTKDEEEIFFNVVKRKIYNRNCLLFKFMQSFCKQENSSFEI